jgi:hypothetical protein
MKSDPRRLLLRDFAHSTGGKHQEIHGGQGPLREKSPMDSAGDEDAGPGGA